MSVVTEGAKAMTLGTMQTAVELLDGWGVQAVLEYPGHIAIELWRANGPRQAIRQHIAFDDFNELLGASVRNAEGDEVDHIETPIPSSCDDAEVVALAIYRALFGEDPKDEQVISGKLDRFRKAFQSCVDGKGAWEELQAAAVDYDAAVDEESNA
jgi:hypothetical protein